MSGSRARRRPLTRNQQVAVLGLFVAIIAAAITALAIVWQTRVARTAYTGPWLRFEYYVCTGPYNNTTETFQRLPVAAADRSADQGQATPHPEFVIRNAVFDVITRLEPESVVKNYPRGSPVTVTYLSEQLLDQITGAPPGPEVSHPAGTRSKDEVRAKLKDYFEFFRNTRPTIAMMEGAGVAPPWVSALRVASPSYDEQVDIAFSFGPHTDDITGVAYFRSTKTLHLRIENISPYNLTKIALQMKALGPFDGPLPVPEDRDSRPPGAQTVVFPLEVLRPGEAIVFPLSVELVPHLAASSLVPGMMPGSATNEDTFDEAMLRATLLSSASQKPIRLRPAFEFDKAQFHVRDETEVLEETRAMASGNVIQVSKNCECGSCPLLFWGLQDGRWMRAREILTNAKGTERSEEFEYELPSSVKSVKLGENPAEAAFFESVEVVERRLDGQMVVHSMIDRRTTITESQPFKIDLTPYRKEGVRLWLRGRGFYVSATKVECPYVFPLPLAFAK